jgi:hypothetical protein
MRTNVGPDPRRRRFASVDVEDRKYSAASVGVWYVWVVMGFLHRKSPRGRMPAGSFMI